MLTNKKGTVLVVAITAMMIMIVIGAICLQIYTNQTILDGYDQVKKRTFYSAEAAVEMMKGYIVKKTEESLTIPGGDILTNYNKGFLATVAPVTGANTVKDWKPFSDNTANYKNLLLNPAANFDGTMHPAIKADVYLHRLTKADETRVKTNSGVNFFKDNGNPNSPQDINSSIFANATAADTSEYRGYEIVATASTLYKTSLSVDSTISTTLRYYFYTQRKNTGSAENPNYINEINWVGWRRD
ncbi:MAG: hypothetical protein K5622_01730 [Endomicrobiaceae bacterium]|nr:hypothetical protein [Endomicrobiaceae bacterium]